MGLAPTTSTTMQMALGDAIAVALLTRRGFTAADFHQIHPGGRLGARLRRVRDLMHTGDAVPLAPTRHADGPRAAADDREALRLPRRRRCRAGRLVGIITDGDLRRAMGPDLLSRRVADVMTSAPRTIGPDALAGEALHVMNARERPITALFVVDTDRPARSASCTSTTCCGQASHERSVPLPVRPPAHRRPGQQLIAAAAARIRQAAQSAAAWPAAAWSSA